MNESDMQLLKRYAHGRSEDAFTELLQRHLALVYSAALRQVQSAELAQEVSQSVFVDLARNAQKLPPNTILSAWLYEVARRSAIDVVRRESRRHLREKTAHQLTDMNSTSADWSEIEPFLDEAMQSLDQADRAAVVLRYFENKSLREVGESLGASENAAQKRLSRAVDRLNEFFASKGIRIGAGALTAAIASNAVQAVPAGLITIISAAVANTATTAFAATAATTLTTMTAKNAILAVALVAAVGTSIYQSHHASALETQLNQVQSQRPNTAPIDHLAQERDAALKQLAALRAEVERNGANPELLRLRNEVSSLKRDARAATEPEPMETAAKSWVTRVNLLRARLESNPAAQVPELQLLKEEDWLAAVKQPNLESEEDFRKAFASLRNNAQGKFAGILQPALTKFLKANEAQFPTDLSQLLPYCEPALDPAILNRYSIQPSRDVPNVKVGGDWAITQKAPVDSEFDSRVVIGPDGFGSASYPSKTELSSEDLEALRPAFKAFEAANGGREAAFPEQVEPYLLTPEQKAAYQKFQNSRASNSASAVK